MLRKLPELTLKLISGASIIIQNGLSNEHLNTNNTDHSILAFEMTCPGQY